ncbi:unnamed protein product [Ostreobium quekettii]|uniref:Uncharacterized protein n=1 Tax=Ostreobium quekettii TaxID=121088 RepID=A0A8S1IQT7_9CHLO|nr:unnamed protein product [Ostreobium quekettii]
MCVTVRHSCMRLLMQSRPQAGGLFLLAAALQLSLPRSVPAIGTGRSAWPATPSLHQVNFENSHKLCSTHNTDIQESFDCPICLPTTQTAGCPGSIQPARKPVPLQFLHFTKP